MEEIQCVNELDVEFYTSVNYINDRGIICASM